MSDKFKSSDNGKTIRRRKGVKRSSNQSKNKCFNTHASQESLQKLADHFNNKRY